MNRATIVGECGLNGRGGWEGGWVMRKKENEWVLSAVFYTPWGKRGGGEGRLVHPAETYQKGIFDALISYQFHTLLTGNCLSSPRQVHTPFRITLRPPQERVRERESENGCACGVWTKGHDRTSLYCTHTKKHSITHTRAHKAWAYVCASKDACVPLCVACQPAGEVDETSLE